MAAKKPAAKAQTGYKVPGKKGADKKAPPMKKPTKGC